MELLLFLAFIIIIIFFISLILYFTNETFRFYCKSILYGLVIISVSLTWPIFLLNPRSPSNQKYVYKLYFNVCRIFGIKYKVRNAEQMDKYDSYVIVSNHQSSLDLLSQATVWPDNCTTIAKKEVIYLGPFGALSYMTGIVYIDRSDTESARKTLSHLAARIKAEKLKVWIFPEGTRNHGTGLLPFKKGAFHLAIDAQVPICPVVISSYYTFYCRYERRFKPGNVIVTCLPPVPTEGLTSDDVDDLTKRVRDQMLETFLAVSDLSPEVRARALENEKVFEIRRLQHQAYKRDHLTAPNNEPDISCANDGNDSPTGSKGSHTLRKRNTNGNSGGSLSGSPDSKMAAATTNNKSTKRHHHSRPEREEDSNEDGTDSYRKRPELWQTDPGITDVIINFFRRRRPVQHSASSSSASNTSNNRHHGHAPTTPAPKKHFGLIDEGFAL